MGIGADFIEVLAHLRANGLVRPNTAVAEIGAQQLDNSFLQATARLKELGTLFGVDQPANLPPPRPTHILRGTLEHLDQGAPLARLFWAWLGFDYTAVDIDGSPGSIPLDLNYDSVPPMAAGRHHVVTNFGTTEHVANQVNAFKVIHDLTALGGLMIHQLPAQGYFNHGLINYNFKFFWMLSRSNDYKFIYADSVHDAPYEIPSNIANFIASLNPIASRRNLRYSVPDAGFTVILQKTLDIPFVAPLDVNTGVKTDNRILKERYWTVFDDDALERLRKERARSSRGDSRAEIHERRTAMPRLAASSDGE
jgi:hypothetical protein